MVGASNLRVMLFSRNTGSVILVVLLFASPIPGNNVQGENDFPATLRIEIEEGSLIDVDITVNAVVSDEFQPYSASWELFDSSSSKHYVSVSEFQQGVTSGSMTEWIFDIDILPETIGSCSCILTVSVIDSNGNSLVESTSVFIESTGFIDEHFTPTLHVRESVSDHWYSESYILDALSSTVDGNVPLFSTIIRSSSTIKCTYGVLESQELVYAVNYNGTLHPSLSDISWDGEKLNFEVDLIGFDDGWHDIIIFAQSEVEDSTYSHDCISIRVDNTPPNVIVEIPEELPEGTGLVYLDASSTYDEIWGIQGLRYTWSINELGGSGEEISQVFSGPDYRSIELSLIHSGIYVVSLTVSDNAGNMGLSSTTLEIVNMAPTARLTVDGEDHFDKDQVTLSPGSSILVDASSSTDTTNDMDGLRYIWRVDNVPTYEGPSRSISWPDTVDGDSFILSIEVIDDDSESSMISIIIVDNSQSGSPPLSILILIISGVFLSYAIFRRSRSDDSEIPKWS